MNTEYSDDQRSVPLDHMIQDALKVKPEHFLRSKEEIIDFIMADPDLPVTYDQIVFLLRHSVPAVNPMRKDYFDVLARLVSESKTHGDAALVKSVYLSIPFYPADKDYQQKRAFFEGGIQYFLSLGLYQAVGELYVHLAGGGYGSTTERMTFCDEALRYLDKTSKEYACILAMRDMLCHRERQNNETYYHYCAFGETVFRKGDSMYLSPIFPCFAFCKKAESLCSDVVILKGNRESYETLTSPDPSGCDKEAVDEAMSVGTSKYLLDEKELVRCPDEKVMCQADGKEYICHVFSIQRVENPDMKICGDIMETNYYARGIGPIRTVISVDGTTYVYDLCKYSIKGGDGMIPCCVGNQWYYRQQDCPGSVDQVVKREIIAQNGEEYLLSGWNYAGRNPFSSCDA